MLALDPQLTAALVARDEAWLRQRHQARYEKFTSVRLYACRVRKPGTVQGERVRSGKFGHIGRIGKRLRRINYIVMLAANRPPVPVGRLPAVRFCKLRIDGSPRADRPN